MRFLITAGPTHEYFDDVRYVGNASTGTMGVEIAAAAARAGHEVVLVLGPSALPDPAGAVVRRVVSARDMHRAVLAELPQADAVVAAAAVADYRPKERVQGKLKKDRESLVLELVKNPDILAEVGTMPGTRVLVGFALEAAPPEVALGLAREKLLRKRCDLIVLNRTGSLGGSRGEDVVLVPKNGETIPLGAPTKRELAERLVRFCEDEVRGRGHAGDHRDVVDGPGGRVHGAGRRGPDAGG